MAEAADVAVKGTVAEGADADGLDAAAADTADADASVEPDLAQTNAALLATKHPN